MPLPDLITTETFDAWLQDLGGSEAFARIAVRIRRLAAGNPGDARPVGRGVSELRVHFGPGYRIYFGRFGTHLILLLAGGDKSTQAQDIETAQRLWAEWKAEQ